MVKRYIERAVHHWSEDSVRLICTPSLTARKNFFYVQEIGHFRTRSHYMTERQHLNSFLIVYTLAGKGSLQYKGNTYTLQANQAFFIDCMEYQLYSTDQHDLWEFVWLHFNGNVSREYYEQYYSDDQPVVRFPADARIPELMKQLIKLHQARDVRTELVSSMLIVQILTDVLLASNNYDMNHTILPDTIQLVAKYLDQHFDEPITLQQLSQQFAISKYHLIKQFKKYIGLTPYEYLIHCRISYAKQLLQYSDLTVAEIAHEAGIDNVTHFINLFKQREGMTPLTFRKQWKR